MKVMIRLPVCLVLAAACGDGGRGQGVEERALRCGDVIGESALVRATTAVDARNCDGTAITVRAPANLDLDGRTVSCDGTAGTVGIRLVGRGARVANGTIENCEAGVTVEGAGGHTLENLAAIHNSGSKDVRASGGIVVQSDENVLHGVRARHNVPVGLQLIGNHNLVAKSDVSENLHMGIAVFGAFNEVSDTQANENEYVNVAILDVGGGRGGGSGNLLANVTANGNRLSHGIFIGTDFNSVTGSDASGNGRSGIRVVGKSNDVIQSAAFDNGRSVTPGFARADTDLFDGRPDCSATWAQNEYGTGNSPCIQEEEKP